MYLVDDPVTVAVTAYVLRCHVWAYAER